VTRSHPSGDALAKSCEIAAKRKTGMIMAIDKILPSPDKEEIRLRLLAAMLANTNRRYSKKAHGSWHSFWQDLFGREKV
jgi:hypothetical protein